MRPKKQNISTKTSPFLTVLENALMLIVLGVIVLRVTYIENPHVAQLQTKFFLTSEIVSMLMSSVLLGCFAVWLLVSILLNRFRWRKTSLEWAIGLFAVAAAVSCLAASDKRAAVTDFVLLVTPMLSAVFLIQLFNSRTKTHLAILLILAVAVTMTVQCIDQLVDSNEMVIQEYERNPLKQLQQMNIEPDSLEHWMHEHRLYSKDIRGFLMTSNSAASFFLLSVFAGLGICVESFRQRKQPETLASFVCYALAFLFALAGLFLTQSKGGIGAFILCMVLFAVLSLFGKQLWKYRIVVGLLLLVGIVLGTAAVVAYGSEHGKLPGGNSMLVRWQYWQSTARMIGEHLWTGVGGGNFRFFYPLYKNAAASETIQDPHNFILSLLSQYGPLGLIAFLAAVLWPIKKSLEQQFSLADLPALDTPPVNKKLWTVSLAVSACLLLFVRPMLVDTGFLCQKAAVRSAAYVVLYLFPAGIFMLAFGLLGAVASGDVSIQKRGHFLTIALACGMIAVLIHNLVDFAIFETGVWNVLWLFVAILIACRHNNPPEDKLIRLNMPKRFSIVVVLCVMVAGYFAVAVIPPIKANRLFRLAMMSRSPQFEAIDRAIAADTLSPDTAYNAAGTLMQVYAQQRPSAKDITFLETASRYADIAQQRNPDSFKPYRLKAEIALALADQSEDDPKAEHLQTAYEMLSQALDRYPGSDRIQYNLGQVAEQLGRPQAALDHYQKAVEIEQAYQAQFKIMYPDREPVISRLGNTAYTIAKAKVEELQKNLSPQQNK